MASRSQVATMLAEDFTADRASAVERTAAWLFTTGRQRQIPYLVNDVARVLSENGYVYAKVFVARDISTEAKSAIVSYVKQACNASEVEIEIIVQPDLIGGVIIETPFGSIDNSVKTKLAQFVEGVINE